MLGNFKVYSNNKEISSFGSRKAKEIFKYMILHKNKKIPLNEIFELFWNDSFIEDYDINSLKNNLNTVLYLLRKKLKIHKNYLFVDYNYCMFRPKKIEIDLEKVNELYERTQRKKKNEDKKDYYLKIIDLYKGELLSENCYDDWVEIKREYYKNLFLNVLSNLSDIYVEEERLDKALDYLEIGFQHDKNRDDLWLKQIVLNIQKENYLHAQNLYDEYKELFNQEDIEILNTNNLKQNLLSKLSGPDIIDEPNIIREEEFDLILNVENKKRHKDFLLYAIELNETDEKDTIIRKLVKIIREEDLITCSKKEIKLLFREVKEKEKATKVIDKKLKNILKNKYTVKQF
jgi:DNA-binding SARP family transcriptional activator